MFSLRAALRHPSAVRTRRLLAALCGLMLLAGCTMVQVGYNQADSLAVWTANEYFDLDARQKDAFLSRFGHLHEWHRYDQLPEYAAFLGAAKKRLQSGLAREDVDWFVAGLKTRYRLIVSRGAGDAAAILASLAPAQLDALQRQWNKDNRKFIREFQLEETPPEQQRELARRMLSRIEDWTGSLSREQEQKITALTDKLPQIDRLRHEDRLRRQREFLQLLELRGNPDEFTPRLRHWLLNWEEGRPPQYERQFNQSLEKRIQFMVDVYHLLTSQQRTHLQQRLQGYIEDFRKLAERGERTAAR
jgi:hypothetical protein